MVHIDGLACSESIEHFSFPFGHEITDMSELAKLAQFARLRSASFCGTGLDDLGLAHVCQVATLETLDLQDTRVSNLGLQALAQLPCLHYLRLKENLQLTNDCIPHLLKLGTLSDLQIHETSIDQQGLQQLTAMNSLRDLCIAGDHYSFEALLEISARMPQCEILAKGRGSFRRGVFEGRWPSHAR